MIALERKDDRWAATLGTAQPFRCDASSPIDQCSDIAPRTSRTLTMLNLAPSSVFSQLLAWRDEGMLDIFQARRAADHCVTGILHQTSFLKARVLLLYNCPNSSSQNTSGHGSRCRCVNRGRYGNRLRPRGGSSVLRSPILKWCPNLRVLPSGE